MKLEIKLIALLLCLSTLLLCVSACRDANASAETVKPNESARNESDITDTQKSSDAQSESQETVDYSVDLENIFEHGYIDPKKVAITDKDGNAKNLICIYLESMETTYGSMDAGGAQKVINYIPSLTELAKNNISFSNSENTLGGFVSLQGTGWTMGALLGTTSGAPFLLAEIGEQSHNSLGKDGTFLNGLTTLGDVLKEKGYNQEFLCGSKASFGGRKTYFEVHGGYEIFDLQSARDKGYVAPDYDNGFWGIEDCILYKIAKDELTALANKGEPFNFTMLTVDTHHVGGYICEKCGNEFSEKLGNVVLCADMQVMDFVEWCMKQDFYKDSVIVIMGDHPRMDSRLVKGVDFFDRTMYNCFINSAIEPQGDTKRRAIASFDMFPSVLAALGYEIEGERLGLGTNIFSSEPTLCEKYGVEAIEGAVSLPSAFYRKNFMKK